MIPNSPKSGGEFTFKKMYFGKDTAFYGWLNSSCFLHKKKEVFRKRI